MAKRPERTPVVFTRAEVKTRADPLDGHGETDLLPMLEHEPRLEPTTLFETLQELYPGQYDDKLRTVQRRVERWKAKHGKPKAVMFKIQHAPGDLGLSDFTHLKGVTVSVKGQPFHTIALLLVVGSMCR